MIRLTFLNETERKAKGYIFFADYEKTDEADIKVLFACLSKDNLRDFFTKVYLAKTENKLVTCNGVKICALDFIANNTDIEIKDDLMLFDCVQNKKKKQLYFGYKLDIKINWKDLKSGLLSAKDCGFYVENTDDFKIDTDNKIVWYKEQLGTYNFPGSWNRVLPEEFDSTFTLDFTELAKWNKDFKNKIDENHITIDFDNGGKITKKCVAYGKTVEAPCKATSKDLKGKIAFNYSALEGLEGVKTVECVDWNKQTGDRIYKAVKISLKNGYFGSMPLNFIDAD